MYSYLYFQKLVDDLKNGQGGIEGVMGRFRFALFQDIRKLLEFIIVFIVWNTLTQSCPARLWSLT